VQRRVKFPHGDYIFFGLSDGTIGGFPSWIAELHTLLGRLRSGAKRDKASLEPLLKERANDTQRTAIDDADEPAVLQE
jgi:hypothetical protein